MTDETSDEPEEPEPTYKQLVERLRTDFTAILSKRRMDDEEHVYHTHVLRELHEVFEGHYSARVHLNFPSYTDEHGWLTRWHYPNAQKYFIESIIRLVNQYEDDAAKMLYSVAAKDAKEGIHGGISR